MNLTFDKMKELVIGAVRTEETENGLQFFRFTEKQQELYRVTSENFYKKTFATAGVRLYFRTDSEKLGLKMFFEAASSRRYFSVDVFADGKMIGCMDNFTEADLPQDYTKVDGECGVMDRDFELGTGVKTVCIYLPWSAIFFPLGVFAA